MGDSVVSGIGAADPRPVPAAQGRDILIAGLQRSGTTLVCTLLNRLENVAALVEPMDLRTIRADATDDEITAVIQKFCSDVRRSAIAQGLIFTKHLGGRIVSNTMSDPGVGPRRSIVDLGWVDLGKQYDGSVTIVVKHPLVFAALAPRLQSRIPVFAIVRNPMAVVASWQTVPINARIGRVPPAERFASDLRQELDAIDDVLTRQVAIVNWHFRTFAKLPPTHVLRYEDIVSTRGQRLSAIVPQAAGLDQPLTMPNLAERYREVNLSRIADALAASERSYAPWYPDLCFGGWDACAHSL